MQKAPPSPLPQTPAEKATQAWVQGIVVKHNLCPFAAVPLRRQQVRIIESQAQGFNGITAVLREELDLLVRTAPELLSNSLLVLTQDLHDFYTFMLYVDEAQALLERMDLEGVVQIATFHPDYEFAGEGKESRSNYTNRSPYPTLHLLREDEIAWAIDHHRDSLSIPERNIRYLEGLDEGEMEEIIGRRD